MLRSWVVLEGRVSQKAGTVHLRVSSTQAHQEKKTSYALGMWSVP
jgi:hypothetical protein